MLTAEERLTGLEPVVAWIKANHIWAKDSDTLDPDFGPTVEWEYCDWCYDHGLPDAWPCMFVKAVDPTAAPRLGAMSEEEATPDVP